MEVCVFVLSRLSDPHGFCIFWRRRLKSKNLREKEERKEKQILEEATEDFDNFYLVKIFFLGKYF